MRRWYLFIKTTLLCVYGQRGGCTAPSPTPYPRPPDSLEFCSGKGKREDKRNLKFREGGEGDKGEREGQRGWIQLVWWHKPVILSTHEAKAGDYKFKAHLATGSSRPT